MYCNNGVKCVEIYTDRVTYEDLGDYGGLAEGFEEEVDGSGED